MNGVAKTRNILPSMAVAVFCILPAVVFCLITSWNFPLVLDEYFFHFPTLKQFTEQFPFPEITNYSSASGPLPFYMMSIWTKLWGLSLPVGRSLSLLVSFSALLLFDLTRRKLYPEKSFPTTYILSLTAYFVLATVSLITINYALLAEISVLFLGIAWIRNPKIGILVGISLLLVVLAWTRLISLALAIPLLWIVWRYSKSLSLKIVGALLIISSLATFLPQYILWHGFSPPVFHADYQANHINPSQLTLSLCMLGLCLAPVAISGIRRWGGMWPYGLFGGMIALLFPIPTIGNFGPVVRVLQGVSVIFPTLELIIEFALASLGMWVVLSLWGEKREERFIMGAFWAYALTLMIAPNTWEHLHYVIWAPILLLLARNTWVNDWQRYASILITGSIAVMMYYQLYMGI